RAQCLRGRRPAVFVFVSSRRRHTRFKCDWSSDVCSSDLLSTATGGRTLFVKDPRELQSGMATIARDLRLQYLLGYTPSRPPAARSEERRVGKKCRRWWA